jgi:hypothetical protein
MDRGITRRQADISLHVVEEFADASVHDALRLANAAFESARAVNAHPKEPKSYAWQFIAYYYAGYFAANALMRLCGYGCTNLSTLECSTINQQALLYGVGGISDNTKLAPGLYYTCASQSGSPLWTLSAVGGKGGVHIQFWIGFVRFLKAFNLFINASALPKTDRDAAVRELDELVAGLQHSGTQNGAWLSEVRNAMNYRLEYGAWFPYQDHVTDGVTLKKFFADTMSGAAPLPTSGQALADPERAARLSAFLLRWLKSSLETLESSSQGQKKSLIVDGALSIAAGI